MAGTETLQSSLAGELVTPGAAKYESARRLWNGMIDKRPAFIVRCREVADVVAAVNFARDGQFRLAVRGGGHNVAGTASADDGVVVDLSNMRSVSVDPDSKTARAQGGATIGDLDAATQAHGLATSMGVVSRTGVAGLTLNGGIGWLRRKHGMSCDNLISVEMVTADGRVLKADEATNPELLWAVKGGGGNFGVVTTFEYRLHRVDPTVFLFLIFYPFESAGKVLTSFRDYMQDAPDDVSPVAFIGSVPEAEPFPAEAQGKRCVVMGGVHCNDLEEGERLFAPLRTIAEPIIDMSGPMPYVEVQKLFDEDYPEGDRYYWKSLKLPALTGEVIELLLEHGASAPSPRSTIDVWYHGGAMGRVGPDATAYGDRSAPILIAPEANWDDPADDRANLAWSRGLLADLERFGDGSVYLNFPGFLDESENLARIAYGANYARLVEIKNSYDPRNLFRSNLNIKPMAG